MKRINFLMLLMIFFLLSQFSFSAVPTNIDSSLLSDSAQIAQDSLFAKINRSFETIKPILENSCYDCHSANTKEPWYFNIPGINSLLTSHIKEGRENLDFTDGFPFKSKESQLAILHGIKEEVKDGEMPLFSYRIIHWGRLIEGEQQDSLFSWIDETILLLNKSQNDFSNPSEKQDSDESDDSDD